ncbi:MAG: hypothetical protein IBX69_05880 [Anaerolineales bacterium]|nr:hypothetical protein [Anaerolineales bacterium]
MRRTKADGWHLQIPPGDDRAYRLAQVDDYSNLRRAKLPYMPELKFNIRARCSSENIPGTWGFGLWNDPFSIRVMPNVEILRLPALPNAAWFFFASSHNYLSIRDDLPAEGSLMATFRSPKIPPLMLTLAVLGLPLLLLPPIARMVRRAGRLLVQQGAALLSHNPTDWHEYGLEWRSRAVAFELDGERVFETQVSPNPPLGLVIWVDNQYAAALPNGRIRYGRLANQEPAWVEVDQIEVLRSL